MDVQVIRAFLGDRCDMQCAHCLNEANTRNMALCDADIAKLASCLNTTFEITGLEFTGGEPFVHFEQMVRITRSLTREIKLSAITNGKILSQAPQMALDLGLTHVSISWDKFHARFIGYNEVERLALRLQDAGIGVEIRCAIQDDSEIFKPTTSSVTVNTQYVDYIGSAKNLSYKPNSKYRWFEQSCSSFFGSPRAAVYLPTGRYTYCCCGMPLPLLVQRDELSADRLEGLSRTLPYVLFSRNASFTKIFEERGHAVERYRDMFRSPCEACLFAMTNFHFRDRTAPKNGTP